MTYHTVAFTANIASTTPTGVDAVQDTILNTVNNRILPGRDYGLIYSYVLGSSVDQARLDSPQARSVILPHFSKIDQNSTPSSDPNFGSGDLKSSSPRLPIRVAGKSIT